MANRLKKTSYTKNDNILRWVSIGLAILGVLDALYLLILKFTQAEAMCVGNHGCITVNNSIYSEIYGIPVSAFGIAAYLAIGLILFLAPKMKLARQAGPLTVFGLGLIGVIFSAYLTYIEAYVIHAFCPFCIASAIIITLIFILAIIRLIQQNAD
jgi:uncharacterized membrane protein